MGSGENRRYWQSQHFILIAVCALSVFAALTGCAGKGAKETDPKSPVVITLWHSYNALAKLEFDSLVQEFNETKGLEKGIIVDAQGYSSSDELDEALYRAAGKMTGADPLPDIFSAYPDFAYYLNQTAPLVELDKYFTREELAEYCPEFLKEGVWDGASSPRMIPVAKSTELLFLNRTDWERFKKASDVSDDMLGTWEGLLEIAGKYYEWSGGRAFLGMNAYNDFAILTAVQSGENPFAWQDGKIIFSYSEELARKVWDLYYTPHIRGWYKSSVYNQDGVKSGKLAAYIGSSAGAGFFPEKVIEDADNSYPIQCEILPYPTFQKGSEYMPQRGANMAVFVSDPAHEQASMEFLKWFTKPDHNLRFAAATGYLPVKQDALKDVKGILKYVPDENNTEAVKGSVKTALQSMESGLFYSRLPFEDSHEMVQIFSDSLDQKIAADLAELDLRLKGREERETVVRELTGAENFESWYGELIKKMAGKTDE